MLGTWSGELESGSQVKMSLAAVGMETPTLAVFRTYLDRIVAYELDLSIEKREAPLFRRAPGRRNDWYCRLATRAHGL